MKKTSIFGVIAASFFTPIFVMAQIKTDGEDFSVRNIVFHLTVIVLSIIAAIYMTSLSSLFKGGMFEKVWKKFTIAAYLLAILAVLIYLDESGLLTVYHAHEVIMIVISILFVSASRGAFRQIVSK